MSARNLGPAIAAFLGLAQFLLMGGGPILDPTHVTWIPPGSDWGYHYVGWLFFRRSAFTLDPLGAIPGLLYPAGTTIALTDGIPWLALALRPFSPLVPQAFQYIGLWLAVCHALNGWFGARLAQALAPDLPPLTVALAGALFVVSPILVLRFQHETLCAHFLLLAAILANLRPSRVLPLALPAIAMGIHPYLAAMVAPLCVAAVVRAWRAGHTTLAGAAARVAGIAAICLGLAVWLGELGVGTQDDIAARGFGRYAADLAAFVSPRGASWIFPPIPAHAGSPGEEAYLGLGWLLFGLAAIVVEARSPRAPRLPWRSAAPLIGATALLTLYALGPRITAFGRPLLDLGALYRRLPFLTGPFRANGRFIWCAAYVLVAGAVAIWVRRRPRAAPWALAAAVALQLLEVKGMVYVARFADEHPIPPSAPAWELARGDLDHLALYPPRCGDTSFTCCGAFTPLPRRADLYLAMRAAGLGLTLNSGGVARAYRSKLAIACADLVDEVTAGRLDARTIYVVAADREAAFRAANPRAPCAALDGELTCVSPAARGRFADLLRGHGVAP